MKLTINSTRFGELIPNVIHEVGSEKPLFDKVLPWIDSAVRWVEDNFLGADYDVPEDICTIAEKMAVYKAFADAIPSLDVVLSPAGFAVINTEGRAPASKERVERLIGSLHDAVDNGAEMLLSRLVDDAAWSESERGKYWLATFITDLAEVSRLRENETLLQKYREMRIYAMRFETEIEEAYIGKKTLDFLRKNQSSKSPLKEIVSQLREKEMVFIMFRFDKDFLQNPYDQNIWFLVRPVVNKFSLYPELHNMWLEEMGAKFQIKPFKNDIQGGFYF